MLNRRLERTGNDLGPFEFSAVSSQTLENQYEGDIIVTGFVSIADR